MGINKNGIINEPRFSSSLLNKYDTEFYVEPDGSVWIRLFHHNNPASKLFANNDTFSTSVYKDSDRWFNIALCNLVSTWELMIKQTATSGGTEQKFRWIQKYNPMTAMYANVASANITKNTSSGYTNFSYGGLYAMKSAVTYLCANDGTEEDWWGATGAYTTHQGGIPAWGGIVVTTGYMDLYLRVDNINISKASKHKVGFTATDFYEV